MSSVDTHLHSSGRTVWAPHDILHWTENCYLIWLWKHKTVPTQSSAILVFLELFPAFLSINLTHTLLFLRCFYKLKLVIFPKAWPFTLSLSLYSYDTWIPASEIEAAVEDPPSPEKPRKVPHFFFNCFSLFVCSLVSLNFNNAAYISLHLIKHFTLFNYIIFVHIYVVSNYFIPLFRLHETWNE